MHYSQLEQIVSNDQISGEMKAHRVLPEFVGEKRIAAWDEMG